MNSDESDELPDWVDSWSDDGGAATTPDADYGHQREYMLNSSQIHEFELDHAERRWHRPCPGCGRLPLGDQSPKEVYNSQQRERWDRFGCLACYAIWQCSLAVKRDVVRVSGDVIWFSDIEADSGLKIRLFNEVGKTDDIVHQFGFARHVAPRADSDEALKCARDWLTSCMQTHPSCRSERGIYSVPTRLLDVSLSNPRLVHSGSLPIDSYAALSHCWGPIQPLRTLHNNAESHAKGMSLASLPKTFQDAVRVTRYLDLRYLWIDSLCIIQDDDEDWSREAAKMAAYYSGAQVVISASSSDGSSEGFLGPRKESIKGTLVIGVGGDVASRIPPLHFRECTVGDSGSIPRQIGYRVDTLSSRGWCFQERLLARRLLSFDNEQLIWECNSACLCESSDTSNPDVSLSGNDTEYPYNHDYNMSARLSGASKAEIYEFWRMKIVQHYASRNLTRKTDRLVAVQGIADVLRGHLNEEYIHGLWKGDVLEGLTWSTRASGSVGIPLDVAPTWSWASVYEPVTYVRWPARSWAIEDIRFTPVNDIRLRLHDKTPRLKIKMRGQLLVAQMEVLGGVGCPRLVLDPSSGLLDGLSVVEAYLDTPCEAVLVEDMLGRAVKTFNRVGASSSQTASQVAHSPATSDAGHSIQVWLLHLFNNKQQRYSMFLVLGLSRRKHGCFERIGTSSVTPKTSDANTMFERFLENQPMTEVSII